MSSTSTSTPLTASLHTEPGFAFHCGLVVGAKQLVVASVSSIEDEDDVLDEEGFIEPFNTSHPNPSRPNWNAPVFGTILKNYRTKQGRTNAGQHGSSSRAPSLQPAGARTTTRMPRGRGTSTSRLARNFYGAAVGSSSSHNSNEDHNSRHDQLQQIFSSDVTPASSTSSRTNLANNNRNINSSSTMLSSTCKSTSSTCSLFNRVFGPDDHAAGRADEDDAALVDDDEDLLLLEGLQEHQEGARRTMPGCTNTSGRATEMKDHHRIQIDLSRLLKEQPEVDILLFAANRIPGGSGRSSLFGRGKKTRSRSASSSSRAGRFLRGGDSPKETSFDPATKLQFFLRKMVHNNSCSCTASATGVRTPKLPTLVDGLVLQKKQETITSATIALKAEEGCCMLAALIRDDVDKKKWKVSRILTTMPRQGLQWQDWIPNCRRLDHRTGMLPLAQELRIPQPRKDEEQITSRGRSRSNGSASVRSSNLSRSSHQVVAICSGTWSAKSDLVSTSVVRRDEQDATTDDRRGDVMMLEENFRLESPQAASLEDEEFFEKDSCYNETVLVQESQSRRKASKVPATSCTFSDDVVMQEQTNTVVEQEARHSCNQPKNKKNTGEFVKVQASISFFPGSCKNAKPQVVGVENDKGAASTNFLRLSSTASKTPYYADSGLPLKNKVQQEEHFQLHRDSTFSTSSQHDSTNKTGLQELYDQKAAAPAASSSVQQPEVDLVPPTKFTDSRKSSRKSTPTHTRASSYNSSVLNNSRRYSVDDLHKLMSAEFGGGGAGGTTHATKNFDYHPVDKLYASSRQFGTRMRKRIHQHQLEGEEQAPPGDSCTSSTSGSKNLLHGDHDHDAEMELRSNGSSPKQASSVQARMVVSKQDVVGVPGRCRNPASTAAQVLSSDHDQNRQDVFAPDSSNNIQRRTIDLLAGSANASILQDLSLSLDQKARERLFGYIENSFHPRTAGQQRSCRSGRSRAGSTSAAGEEEDTSSAADDQHSVIEEKIQVALASLASEFKSVEHQLHSEMQNLKSKVDTEHLKNRELQKAFLTVLKRLFPGIRAGEDRDHQGGDRDLTCTTSAALGAVPSVDNNFGNMDSTFARTSLRVEELEQLLKEIESSRAQMRSLSTASALSSGVSGMLCSASSGANKSGNNANEETRQHDVERDHLVVFPPANSSKNCTNHDDFPVYHDSNQHTTAEESTHEDYNHTTSHSATSLSNSPPVSSSGGHGFGVPELRVNEQGGVMISSSSQILAPGGRGQGHYSLDSVTSSNFNEMLQLNKSNSSGNLQHRPGSSLDGSTAQGGTSQRYHRQKEANTTPVLQPPPALILTPARPPNTYGTAVLGSLTLDGRTTNLRNGDVNNPTASTSSSSTSDATNSRKKLTKEPQKLDDSERLQGSPAVLPPFKPSPRRGPAHLSVPSGVAGVGVISSTTTRSAQRPATGAPVARQRTRPPHKNPSNLILAAAAGDKKTRRGEQQGLYEDYPIVRLPSSCQSSPKSEISMSSLADNSSETFHLPEPARGNSNYGQGQGPAPAASRSRPKLLPDRSFPTGCTTGRYTLDVEEHSSILSATPLARDHLPQPPNWTATARQQILIPGQGRVGDVVVLADTNISTKESTTLNSSMNLKKQKNLFGRELHMDLRDREVARPPGVQPAAHQLRAGQKDLSQSDENALPPAGASGAASMTNTLDRNSASEEWSISSGNFDEILSRQSAAAAKVHFNHDTENYNTNAYRRGYDQASTRPGKSDRVLSHHPQQHQESAALGLARPVPGKSTPIFTAAPAVVTPASVSIPASSTTTMRGSLQDSISIRTATPGGSAAVVPALPSSYHNFTRSNFFPPPRARTSLAGVDHDNSSCHKHNIIRDQQISDRVSDPFSRRTRCVERPPNSLSNDHLKLVQENEKCSTSVERKSLLNSSLFA
ncbi:unnamed protein product [Amoebophrya sp. A120]|nr:unnamed protein product [Amoebophrya sp. A120]|eukprot:GSA120T00021750001.1